jgi:plastocyanin
MIALLCRASGLAGLVVLATGLGAAAETIHVTIDKMSFMPAEVRVQAGDTIVWDNKDIFAHTVTVRGGPWDLVMPAKKSAEIVAGTAGTFNYYCRFHPNMVARVIVADR